jgi:multiple sugar transport system substrate-binding protein
MPLMAIRTGGKDEEMKRFITGALAITLGVSMLAGCSASNTNASSQPSSSSPAATDETTAAADTSAAGTAATDTDNTTASSDKPYDGVTLTYALSQTASQGAETNQLVNLVKEKTGITIKYTIVPEKSDGDVDKTLVSLTAGEPLDIVYYATPNLRPFYNAGVLEPLEDLAAKQNYDMQKVYGDYLPVFDGKVYGLPAFTDIWLTLYNKAVFDDAGVPYPTADGWTWNKYIDTAKKLTNPDKNTWGSLMLDYDNYNYMYAVQEGASHYKADGTSNYDDPVFKKSLQFFYDLGNVDKIQPSILEFKSTSIPWDAFFAQTMADTAGYKYGMFVCGGWTLSSMADLDKYKRDWKFGILPMPYPDDAKPSTLTVPGCYAIPTTSQNKDAAFAAIACIAENQYTLGYGRVPARRDLTDDQINDYINNKLVTNYANDGVTVDDFKNAWFDPNRTAYNEKVIGPGSAEISAIWTSEGQLYGQGGEDIDTAMKNILDRANKAIADSGEVAAQQ